MMSNDNPPSILLERGYAYVLRLQLAADRGGDNGSETMHVLFCLDGDALVVEGSREHCKPTVITMHE